MRNKFILVAALTAIFMAICSFGANAQKRISEIDFNIRVGIGFYENFWHMGISKVSCDYDSEGRLKTAKFVFSTVLYGNALSSSMQKKANDDHIGRDTSMVALTWYADSVVVEGKKPFENDRFRLKYLLDNGRAIQLTDGKVEQRFFYNSKGEMTDAIYRFGRPNQIITSFTHQNQSIAQVKGPQSDFMPTFYDQTWGASDVVTSYTPGTIPNHTGIDMIMLERMPFFNMLMVLAGIDGKHSEFLPQSRIYASHKDPKYYYYELDSDNLPTKITSAALLADSTIVNLRYVSAPPYDPGSVNSTTADADVINIQGRVATVSTGRYIAAYDLQGRKVASSPNGTVTLPQAGIYILRSGSATMKAAVR